MTPTLPDRRQPRPVEQQLVRRENGIWDERAIRDWVDGMAPAPRTRVERLSRRPGVDELPRATEGRSA